MLKHYYIKKEYRKKEGTPANLLHHDCVFTRSSSLDSVWDLMDIMSLYGRGGIYNKDTNAHKYKLLSVFMFRIMEVIIFCHDLSIKCFAFLYHLDIDPAAQT